ncbi:MAG TPA: NAD-dependent epimerase/dehydratase family protein [Opitutaceae bacterium]|nr:NAD-dependent epimerase/dehydratase family protein [Opitutaceae bacterium]
MPPLLNEDIADILDVHSIDWEILRGKRVFITGGTGFFGCWLIEAILAANEKFRLCAELVVQSRDPEAFLSRNVHFARRPGLRWVKCGIFELTPAVVWSQLDDAAAFDCVIHLVTEGNLSAFATDPIGAIDVIVGGTRAALEFARDAAAQRFLFTSSGSVYAKPMPLGVKETELSAPSAIDVNSSYAAAGNAKRQAELLCAAFAKQHGIHVIVARCFTFVGPYLPLDEKFAVGNFIRDALQAGEVVVRGDGTPVRSYMYGSDLAVWLLALLTRGRKGAAYNVGAKRPCTIGELAHEVANVSIPPLRVKILGAAELGRAPDVYVPSVELCAAELGLKEKVGLPEAIQRTLRWARLSAQG